jgi:hypothetical protein
MLSVGLGELELSTFVGCMSYEFALFNYCYCNNPHQSVPPLCFNLVNVSVTLHLLNGYLND